MVLPLACPNQDLKFFTFGIVAWAIWVTRNKIRIQRCFPRSPVIILYKINFFYAEMVGAPTRRWAEETERTPWGYWGMGEELRRDKKSGWKRRLVFGVFCFSMMDPVRGLLRCLELLSFCFFPFFSPKLKKEWYAMFLSTARRLWRLRQSQGFADSVFKDARMGRICVRVFIEV